MISTPNDAWAKFGRRIRSLLDLLESWEYSSADAPTRRIATVVYIYGAQELADISVQWDCREQTAGHRSSMLGEAARGLRSAPITVFFLDDFSFR